MATRTTCATGFGAEYLGGKMGDIDEAVKKVKDHPEDVEAWENLRDQIADPQKKQDCQDQVDRLLGKKRPLDCPQCGAGMEIVYKGELRDKFARCTHCGTEVDLQDEYAKTEVNESHGESYKTRTTTTRITVSERRKDGITAKDGGDTGVADIQKLISEEGFEGTWPSRAYPKLLRLIDLAFSFLSVVFAPIVLFLACILLTLIIILERP